MSEKKYDEFIFDIDDYVVHIYFDVASPVLQQINEARHRGRVSLGGTYSANDHTGHVPGSKQHLHLYAGQREIAAVNLDGTGHDRYSRTRLPNRVATAISKMFPQFILPPNNVLESVPTAVDLLLRMQFKFKLQD